MKCVICKNGKTIPGYTTVTLQRNNATIILRDVPADICENCGEYYLSEDITQKVHERAEKAFENGIEVEILRFAA